MNILKLNAREIARGVKKRQYSAEEVSRLLLSRYKKWEPHVDAVLSLSEENIIKSAKNIDSIISAGSNPGPLAGVPVAIKDNICTTELPTTCGSRMLAGYISPYDATAVERLKKAGAIIFCKSNCDEFAMGSSCEYSAWKVTKNPWDTNCVAGGSSGGSAAAVASRMVPIALGSDTGGSVRQPAAFCGVVGLKPSYGRVSRYGLVAFASSLDHIGIIALNVEDAASVYRVISGFDPSDSTSLKLPSDAIDWKKMKNPYTVGYLKEIFEMDISNDIRKSFEKTLALCEREGFIVKETSLPSLKYALAVYHIIADSEASSNLARYDGVRYGARIKENVTLVEMYRRTRSVGFGEEVKRRIMIGTYCLCAGYYDEFYKTAQRMRILISNEYRKIFEKVDILLTPTTPTTAFKIGEKIDDPIMMYLNDIMTVVSNIAGAPAISLPCGLSKDKLPIGVQVMVERLGESKMLCFAKNLEEMFAFDKFPNGPDDA